MSAPANRSVVVRPHLSASEATAIQRMLGRPDQEFGLRTSYGTPAWLDRHVGDAALVIDALVARFDQAIVSGVVAVEAMAFDAVEFQLIHAAMDHELYGWKNNAVFVSRFGVDIRRAQQLQAALRSEHALVRLLHEVPIGPLRSQVVAMRNEAQLMRASRAAIFNGVTSLDLCPELNLLFDACQLAAGRTTLSWLEGNVARAWKAYGEDVGKAAERARDLRSLRNPSRSQSG